MMRLSIAAAFAALIAVGHAGDTAWASPTPACAPVTTTVYSVDTSYIEKTTTTTVYSTKYDTVVSTVHVTDTTTVIQVKPTTVYDTVPTTVVVPTTIVSATTVVNNVPTTVVVPTTIASTTTVVRVTTSFGVTTVAVPTTVTTCPSSTRILTGLVTCTSRIVNPTYTPKAKLPSDYLWGCPPGTICTPPQIDCNWEQNPPADTYFCAPSECKPVPPLPKIPDFNATWPNPTEPDCAWYDPVLGYFHLDPEYFGLTYAIFDVYGQEVCPVANPAPAPKSVGWVDWIWPKGSHPPRSLARSNNPLADIRRRQAGLAIAPAQCMVVFDSTNLVAQHTGFDYDALCPPTTDFQRGVASCKSCIATWSNNVTTTEDYPALQQYYQYCLTATPPSAT